MGYKALGEKTDLEGGGDPRSLELLDEAVDVRDASEVLLHGLSQLRILHKYLHYVLPHLC